MNDVCIIGMGRVGLPLALSLEEHGLHIGGVDLNHEALNAAFQKGEMPFFEPEYDDLVKTSKIKISPAHQYPESKAYVITVGTPLKQHIETDLSYVKNVVESLFNGVDMTDKLLILRSTLSPGTTTYIKNWINTKTKYEVGKNVFLAMCPERLAEGVAHQELTQLPQIIGTEDNESFSRAQSIFSVFGVKIFHTNYIEAELSKLFCNIYRYVNFSIPNYFAYLCDCYGVDSNSVFNAMNTDYPRNSGLKKPGFAAGTCLRKDWGMLNQNFPQTDLILQAYKINEFMPKFYCDLVGNNMMGKNVGILGYTMKNDTDDTRDSLTPKLIRYIEKYVPKNIFIAEPYLPCGHYDDMKFNEYVFENEKIEDVINKSDIIFIAMNHTQFKSLNKSLFKDKIVVDIWNIFKEKTVNNW